MAIKFKLVARNFSLQNSKIKKKKIDRATAGLGLKSLRGNRIYKGCKDIAEKAHIALKKPRNPLKSLNFSEKVFKNI
jgi:hypothetical protein